MKNIFQTPKPTPKRLVSLAMLIALAFIVGKFSIPIIPQQLVVIYRQYHYRNDCRSYLGIYQFGNS